MKYVRDQPALEQFGKRFRQLRLASGLTQEELADQSGLQLSQISRIERGIINTSLSTIFVLARTLNVDVRELFDFSTV